jgi:hypothetical protein
MGLFGLLLLALIVLAITGLGWEVFTSGIIDGFEKAVDIGTPVIKNLTHEARIYVNDMEQLTS